MSDARRERKPRQVRVQLTAGVGDLEAFSDALRQYADREGWALTLDEDPIPFGDHGPLCKKRLGFIQAPDR